MDQPCVLYLQPASITVLSAINRSFSVVVVILAISTAWRVVLIEPESESAKRPTVDINKAAVGVSMPLVVRLITEDVSVKNANLYQAPKK